MPDATTLNIGQQFDITNRSTGIVTVNANGGGLLQTMVGGSQAIFTVVTNGTSAGTWDVQYSVSGIVAAINPTVQKVYYWNCANAYNSYWSAIYTEYAWSEAARAAGAGSGTAGATAGNAATASTATTFGTSLLSAGAGNGGVTGNGNNGGAGGTSSARVPVQ